MSPKIVGLLALALLAQAGAAKADEGPLPAVAASGASSKPAPKPEFVAKTNGIDVGTIVTSGNGLTGTTSGALAVGGQTMGIKSFGQQRGLLQWDASGGLRIGGTTGYKGPMLGVQGDFGLEAGSRFYTSPKTCWSPYAGGGGRFTLSPVYMPNETSANNQLANLTKVGDSEITASGRVSAGASCLTADYSLMFYGFGQESIRYPDGAPDLKRPLPYTDVGVGARFDTKRLTIAFETLYGMTISSDPYADQATKFGVSATVGVKLPNRWTVQVAADISRDQLKHAEIPAEPATVSGKVMGMLVIPIGK